MDQALHAALSQGAAAVTPNRRLARHLQRSFAALAEARSDRVWATPAILPYRAWLETLWLEALAADAIRDPLQLLTPGQAAYNWQRVVSADAARGAALIDTRATARLASDAWELLHGWGAGGESWRGWPTAALGEDCATFVRWTEAYAALLRAAGALDLAQLPDALARSACRMPGLRGRVILLTGFLELSPQQLRLTAALAAAGASIEPVDTLPEAARVAHRAAAATVREELACALAWARTQLLRPEAVVGIVVEDLSARRAEVRALAEEMLCPALQLPGRESEPRPYNISLGGPLGEVALVAGALGLIALATAPLPVEKAAAVLRSPYLDGSRAMWTKRASIEERWLDEGRREVSLRDAMTALSRVDASLAERWQMATARAPLPASASPREWAEAWRDWLIALGWPGDAALSSAEYQARVAWDALLVEFGGLSAVERRLPRSEAASLLMALAETTIFQPEAPEAPIQILGLLEAQGLNFDALWVSGLSAERWPRAPEPDALLPLFWQRERNLPRSTPARELAYARLLTERYLRAAPRVILSHPSERDDYACAASTLIADLPLLALDPAALPPTAAEAIRAAAPALESVLDDGAPALESGKRVRGGAGLFEKQSECPFRAVAVHRLNADRWPVVATGLSAIERGVLLHKVLAALWADLRDQKKLRALSPAALAARVEAAVAKAMSSDAIAAPRRRALPALAVSLEAGRLSSLARQWLEVIEQSRPPFEVLHTELALPLSLGGIEVGLQLDRIDQLENGRIAIIDYKTGRVVSPAKWFDPRPQAPQLGLYALAWHAKSPQQPVGAVAYAQVKRGELKLQGLAVDNQLWPGLATPSSVCGSPRADWNDVESRWRELLAALAGEIFRGHAPVAPRDAETCRRCGLHALCRIGTLAGEERSAPTDDD